MTATNSKTRIRKGATMSSPLREALINEAIREKRIEPEPVVTDHIREKPQPGPKFRRELRLLLKATVDMKLVEQNQEFTNSLRRVPWANSQARATRAANTLLMISEWAAVDRGPAVGEEVSSMWGQAARLAEILAEDYSGWPHEAYEDIAATFFSAMSGFDERIFRGLLTDLNASGETKRT